MAGHQLVPDGHKLRPWTVPERIAFRVTFCHLFLICLGMAGILRLFVIVFTSGDRMPSGALDAVWHRVVPWVGIHLLRLPANALAPRSTETLYDYVRQIVAVDLGRLQPWVDRDRRPNR
jgi:hypothetical protein